MNLQTKLTDGGRIYKMYASRLEKLGIERFEDFLYHVPFRYDDFSLITQIDSLQEGETVTVQGTVIEIKNQFTRSYKTLQKALITDGTGTLELLWFNQPYIAKSITTNDTVSVSGKVEKDKNKLSMHNPSFEIVSDSNPNTLHTGRLVPIYPETKGVTSKWLRRQVYKMLLEYKEHIHDFLPEQMRENEALLPLTEALNAIHFPKDINEAMSARERLAFDELFLTQMKAKIRKAAWEKELHGQAMQTEKFENQFKKFVDSLPFTLTPSQDNAVEEILKDLSKEKPMNRLLQGDVGSGKTVVAACAMYMAHVNGYQSVLMAPTEILAQQHYATLERFLSPFGIKVDLVTGSKKSIMNHESGIKNKKNKQHDSKFMLHDTNILVGTHAVLSKNVTFHKLGLVVIDEQQRFGVEQRGIIREKGNNPHVLTMTATPIPRTVALTMYGDLDLSYLRDMPKGRQRIKTWLVPTEKRDPGYEWIKKEIQTTESQVFIICPFIEESENMTTIKAAKVEYERLQRDIFPEFTLGLLHGKQKAKEKDAVLQDFREKKFDILVATPVVEVGIDIPNATIIVIEAAERFGLAQLHQLRGRVGRGEKQSYCLLFTEAKNPKAIERLKAMEIKHNGAELAELDLRLRGPGDMFGTMQHGVPKLKVASFSDFDLIERTKREVERIFPELSKHKPLHDLVSQQNTQIITPD